MMTAYINNDYNENALKLFDEMNTQYFNIEKDNVFYSVVIDACTNSNHFYKKGQEIHNKINLKLNGNEICIFVPVSTTSHERILLYHQEMFPLMFIQVNLHTIQQWNDIQCYIMII